MTVGVVVLAHCDLTSRSRVTRGGGVPQQAAGQERTPGSAVRAPARRPGFPAESCNRCPQAWSRRSGRGCAGRGGHGRPRTDHADRSTADHPVRGEAGTDEEELAACRRRGPAREATMAQQAVAVLVPGCRWTAPTRMRPRATARPRCRHAARASHPRPAGDHSHCGPCEPGPAPGRRARTGAVPVIIGFRPSPASPSSPAAPPPVLRRQPPRRLWF